MMCIINVYGWITGHSALSDITNDPIDSTRLRNAPRSSSRTSEEFLTPFLTQDFHKRWFG